MIHLITTLICAAKNGKYTSIGGIMSLSCDCQGFDTTSWFYHEYSEWFIPYPNKRRKGCANCKKLIAKDDDCIKFERAREDMFGEWIHLAPKYLCERCGEIFLTLSNLGYCLRLGQGEVDVALAEYWAMTGFRPR